MAIIALNRFFNPRNLAGLDAWYRGDKVTLNGTTVSTWNDQSGTSNDATQGTAASQPLLVNAVKNGLPVLRFDGVDDSLNITRPFTGSTQTIFFVAKTTDITNGSVVLTTSTVGGDRYIVIVPVGTDLVRFAHYDPTVADSPTGIGTNFVLVTCIQNGTNGTAYLNGRSGTTNSGFSTDNTRTLDSIGGYTSAAFRMEGDIAEIVYYNRVLTDSERIIVEAYLNKKYRLF